MFLYNLPEIGERIQVSFSNNGSLINGTLYWGVYIPYPKIKVEDLFDTKILKKIVKPIFPYHVYTIKSGPLAGACISDWSLHPTRGLTTGYDHTISVTYYEDSILAFCG